MAEVKIHMLDVAENEGRTVSYEEALKTVAEALVQGRAIIDKHTGMVIDKLTPGVEEILIVDLVDGG